MIVSYHFAMKHNKCQKCNDPRNDEIARTLKHPAYFCDVVVTQALAEISATIKHCTNTNVNFISLINFI